MVVSRQKKHETRRISTMVLKSVMAKFRVLLLALLIFVPAQAWAGGIFPFGIADTDNDTGVLILFGFWDQRDGNTWIQLTNTDRQFGQRYHIQIFDVSDDCRITSFFDDYTKDDTHVYNFSNLVSNDGGDSRVFTDPSYGIFVATLVDSDGDIDLGSSLGNLRIVRDEGYEYRTNLNGFTLLSVVFDVLGALFSLPANYVVPFDSNAGNNMSDVVGIAVLPGFDVNTFTGTGTVSTAGNIFAGFSATLIDDKENIEDCPPVAFVCDLTTAGFIADLVFGFLGQSPVVGFDLGINSSHPASRTFGLDGDNICSGSQAVGQVRLDGFVTFIPPTLIFSGFYGLNNGDGTGSMDTFISTPFSSIGFLDLFGIQPIIRQIFKIVGGGGI